MRALRSLQVRIGLSISLVIMLVWLLAAMITAINLRAEMDEVFDSALRETAERILPLAVTDIIGREEEGVLQRLAAIRDHDEFFTFLVRDAQGRILLQSHAADPSIFPDFDGHGFRQTDHFRIYNEAALQGSIRISVAEPLAHRDEVAREIQMGLSLPLLFVIPVALLAVILAVRASFGSLRRFRLNLEARGAHDLSPLPTGDLPSEIDPAAMTLNKLFARLREAFDAERSFAANAAHELRTPLAGAMAQAQRLQAETQDSAAAARAADIEATLKRLTRLSERLMQLARAEGSRLRLEQSSDLRPVIGLVVEDVQRSSAGARIQASLPDAPLLSDLDPDALAILCRNLLDNALRHGAEGAPVVLSLDSAGLLCVANEGPPVPPEALERLTQRFERAGSSAAGSGLGLAIVAAIAERIGSKPEISSPRPGQATGFQVCLRLPLSLAEGG
jgi:two-component system OmpR family sensor kinase